jgi:hypothetical protein
VEITDVVAASAPATSSWGIDTFRSIVGPTYGTVYRGVAYVASGKDEEGPNFDH